MENVTDALKIAAAVLIFVLALSISINAFGEVRQTSKIILDYKDREYDYSYVEENKDENGNSVTKRIVGAETIVPSIYKAYKENFKIVFENICIYEKKDVNSLDEKKEIYTIDLEKDVLGNDTQKEKFIKAILYGFNSGTDEETWENIKTEFEKMGIYLNSDGLYGKIIGKKFEENLGVYYQEEIYGTSDSPNANKTKKRVITYKEL